jgi:hypothetical protein
MASMTREVVVQKGIAFGLVGLAIAFLSPFQIALLFSVLGQGHFLGAYYYQWKAGKVRARWVFVYALLTAALFALAIGTYRFEWFAIGAAVLFYLHHFQDEVTLWGKERSFLRSLEGLVPVIIYTGFTADALLGTSLSAPASIVALILFAVYVVLARARRYRPDELSVYCAIIAAALLLVKWVFMWPLPVENLIGSVILFHYVCWYIYFYYRFAKDTAKQVVYVKEMLAIHAVVFGCLALFLYTTWGSLWLEYIFLPLYFYIWAILHILFSVRLADYRALARW